MEKPQKDIVLIVCGYGCTMTNKNEEYIWQVYQFIIDFYPRIKIILPCGAATQEKTNGNKTEADLICQGLLGLWFGNHGEKELRIICENRSVTTRQNLENVAEMIRFWKDIKPTTHMIVIFCDTNHAMKVGIFADKYFPSYKIERETYDFFGADRALRQLFLTNYDILSLWFPPLAWLKLAVKKNRAKHN